MPVPLMTAEAAISPASDWIRGGSTDAVITYGDDGHTCRACCGAVFKTCCSARCPEGQSPWCHCDYYGPWTQPRCQCT